MASESEQIVDHTMKGKKPLCLTGGFESTHLSFPYGPKTGFVSIMNFLTGST